MLTHQIVGLLAIEAVEEPGLVTSAWIDEQLAGTDEGGALVVGRMTQWCG